MRRLQLIELEDQPWFPASLRDSMTNYLQTTLLLTNPYSVVVPRLQHALDHTGDTRIIDLGAGAGGPWVRLLPQLAEGRVAPRLVFTDKYPNVAALRHIQHCFPEHIEIHPESVDATNVQGNLRGFRTLFSSFHHFPPDMARAILADAVQQRQGIAIFEATTRQPTAIAGMAVTPVMALLLAPLARPLRWSHLFWSYIVPIQPLAVLFDGVVSCLRTYTPAELRAMVADIPDTNQYVWEIGEEQGRGVPIPITYLIGYPKS